MTEPAITVENLSKLYRIGLAHQRHDTLRDQLAYSLRNIGRRFTSAPRLTEDELWALRDVSFEVQSGEAVGIIGRNGAGKSTLLKILSRITEPTSGRVVLNGRVGSLLEVGTGFHPELTGRENIYLNGAILGMHRVEIEHRFDEIVDFSGIERFLETPVKRYSSGMYVRLAFAVAAHLEPEILIVDEVLAVGDATFQKKCLGKMGDVAAEGRTVLFVSHNMAAVKQLTNRSILLKSGKVVFEGRTKYVTDYYSKEFQKNNSSIYYAENAERLKIDDRKIEFIQAEFENPYLNTYSTNDEIPVILTCKGNETINNFRINFTIFQSGGGPVGGYFGKDVFKITKGSIKKFKLILKELSLAPGNYHLGISVGKGYYQNYMVDYDILLNVLHFEIKPVENEGKAYIKWNNNWGSTIYQKPQIIEIDEK